MDIEDMDLDAFFGLEPEDADEAETDGANEQEVAEPAQTEETNGVNEQEVAEPAKDQGQMSPEERHANAARRRAAELDNVRKDERARAQSEMDAFVKELGLKNPYSNNQPIETKEQYDEFKKAQKTKTLERKLSTGKLTVDDLTEAVNDAVDARLAGSPSDTVDPSEEQMAEMNRQYAEIKALDPDAATLEDLAKDDAFVDVVRRTGNMVDAYKLTHFDELQGRQAQMGKLDAANRSQSKSHLQRTAPRGIGSLEITSAMREAYRVFDPDITDDEIRKYESKDSQIRRR